MITTNDIRRRLLFCALWVTGLVMMSMALFLETAASASNDYRLGMAMGILLAAVSDTILYWVFSNARLFGKFAAAIIAIPPTIFILLDWASRGPYVFTR